MASGARLLAVAANAEQARGAIENVCAGNLDLVREFYDPRFHDHVNTMEFRGHEGIAKSVSLYRRLFADLRFVVDEQVTEEDRVASRWTLHGTNRGRAVSLGGITISRLEDGKIVEDWGFTDSLELVRQLGLWRSVLMALTEWRLLLELARAQSSAGFSL
jgi:predicted ester cyclase